jgi:uncharacterized protein YndB with AHSA1/START domain
MATTMKNKSELTITRIFDAPLELAWKAWTEPERMKTWWGPQYFTAPVIKTDLRVGGKYLYCMRGPDGKDYWSTGVYRELVPMERLVMTDSFADEKGNVVPASHYGMTGEFPLELLVTVTFEAIGNRTKMVLRHEGIPDGRMQELTLAGWSGSFDKLAESIVPSDRTRVIAEPGKQEVVVTRVVDAPRYLAFRAHTDPALVPNWWGPARFTTIIERMEARPGGPWRFVQTDAAGNQYAFHGVYHDVVSPERIVSTFEFEGAPGHVSLGTTTFEEIGGGTRITSRSVFQTVQDRDEMIKEGMEVGMLETMDRLVELLGKLKTMRKAA